MYKFNQSSPKPILSPYSFAQNNRHFPFITTTILTILPTKFVTPYIKGSQQRYVQKYINYKKPLTNTQENNNYLFSFIPKQTSNLLRSLGETG